jgi:hypothetical protein
MAFPLPKDARPRSGHHRAARAQPQGRFKRFSLSYRWPVFCNVARSCAVGCTFGLGLALVRSFRHGMHREPPAT